MLKLTRTTMLEGKGKSICGEGVTRNHLRSVFDGILFVTYRP